MLYSIIGILIIIIIFLSVKLRKKQKIDKNELWLHQTKIGELAKQQTEASTKLAITQSDLKSAETRLETIQSKTNEALVSYKEAIEKKNSDLNIQFKEQEENLNSIIENERQLKQKNLDLWYNEQVALYDKQNEDVKAVASKIYQECDAKINEITNQTNLLKSRYESLIAPLKQYEMDQQQRLYYTIQVPDEYKEDIEFLITTVSQKVQHPDIINKLVWSEYVKPYLDETFKRVGIEDKSGIYKITSLLNGKCYIGKSTNIKKRITDHFKSVVKIQSIADQIVHHAIADEGYWNWTIEPIIYCEKEKLSELEKYYIKFFKSEEWGYNRNQGG